MLAVGVVSWHTIHVSYGVPYQDLFYRSPFWRPPVAGLLGMFFALSGFLVAGSLERCRSAISFVGLRVMRIFPALVVEVLLSALILGPLITTFDLGHYFRDSEFAVYLINVTGQPHFHLPGVFLSNPYPDIVNGQLWTVPFELRCYEVLTGIALLGLYRRKYLFLVAVAAWAGAVLSTACYSNCEIRGTLTGNQLVLCFLVGAALYRFRAEVVWSAWLAALAAAAAVALLIWHGVGDAVSAIPLGYLTVFLGLCNPPRSKLIFSGDYSYGIFLYGFPIQQTIASWGSWTHQWYISLALSLPIAVGVAVCSWWLIEKPVLTRKPWLMALERKVLGASDAGRAWLARRAAGRGAA